MAHAAGAGLAWLSQQAATHLLKAAKVLTQSREHKGAGAVRDLVLAPAREQFAVTITRVINSVLLSWSCLSSSGRPSKGTIEEATALCRKGARGNLFIKIPGTAKSLPAIEGCCASRRGCRPH